MANFDDTGLDLTLSHNLYSGAQPLPTVINVIGQVGGVSPQYYGTAANSAGGSGSGLGSMPSGGSYMDGGTAQGKEGAELASELTDLDLLADSLDKLSDGTLDEILELEGWEQIANDIVDFRSDGELSANEIAEINTKTNALLGQLSPEARAEINSLSGDVLDSMGIDTQPNLSHQLVQVQLIGNAQNDSTLTTAPPMTSQFQQSANPPEFPANTAKNLIEVAKLPAIYEKALYEAGDALGDRKAWEGKNPEANQIAQEAVNAAAAELNISPENIHIVQFDNTTAVIVYDPATNEATIAFDPTSERSNVTFNADEIDGVWRGHTDHSLGGEVHKGFYEDIDPSNSNMIDEISGILQEYASDAETPLQVNFTGFSRGGAITTLAAGDMMANNLFDDNNIALNSVITFGAPGSGDEQYVQTFNDEAQRLGADVWAVELHGDGVPTVLTSEGSNIFTRYDYDQVGDRAYIDQDGNVTINPNEATLDTLRDQPAPDAPAHNSNQYSNAVNAVNTQSQGNTGGNNVPATPTQAPEISQETQNAIQTVTRAMSF